MTLPTLDLSADVLTLTRALVDAPSVSGDEEALADAVEAALRALGGLEVERVGNAVLARTNLDLPTRVVLAGHLDTVPIADNVPSSCGRRRATAAVRLRHQRHEVRRRRDAAAGRPVRRPRRRARARPHVRLLRQRGGRARARTGSAGWPGRGAGWLYGDLAVLLEPTDGEIEAGCQGTLRARLDDHGTPGAQRPQLARRQRDPRAAPQPSTALAAYRPREVEIDGCPYREGLNAVGIERRGRGQRDPRRGRADGQLPLRARPRRGRRRGARARGVRRGDRRRRHAHRHRQRRGRAARAGRAGGGRVRRRRRPPGAGQARLDRRRPVRRLRHPGGQLRPRRPAARPHPRGTRPRRPAAAGRGRPDRLPVREHA